MATPKTYDVNDLPLGIANNIAVDALDHWVWGGSYHPDGLPLIGSKMAHSAIYRHLNPEISDKPGRIFRTCGSKTCVNPAHMRYPQRDGALALSKLKPAVRDAWLNRPSGSRTSIAQIEKEVGGVEKVEVVEKDAPNNADLVKVLQRIAEALEEANRK